MNIFEVSFKDNKDGTYTAKAKGRRSTYQKTDTDLELCLIAVRHNAKFAYPDAVFRGLGEWHYQQWLKTNHSK